MATQSFSENNTPSAHRLEPLLNPRSVAIVGARAREGSPGNNVMHTCINAGFQGPLYLVNPTTDEIEGRQTYPSLMDISEPIDVAALVLANPRIEQAFQDLIESGVRAAVMYGSCVLEEPDLAEGELPLRERIVQMAQESDIPICGINGSGFNNREAHVSLQLQDIGRHELGSVCLLSQSGSIYSAMVLNDGRLRFNLSVSTGQEITVDMAEYMDYALDMESTRTIGLFLETVRQPDAFVAALKKAAERDVAVVALKVARTEQSKQFALSHSGAIAGDDSGFDAVFDEYGVLSVDDPDEWMTTLQLLDCGKRAGKGGLVAIADSGGERELLTDVAEACDVPLTEISEQTKSRIRKEVEFSVKPENPLDAWDSGFEVDRVFQNSMHALMDDEGAAAGLWIADMHDDLSHYWSYGKCARSIAEQTDKPLAFVSCYGKAHNPELANELARSGVPVLDGMRPALKAVRCLMDYRDFQDRRRTDAAPSPDQALIDVANTWRERLGDGNPLGVAETMALLEDFGMPVIGSRFVDSEEAALNAAQDIGYPVALKTADTDIQHKSDVGGVCLDLETAEELGTAYVDLAGKLGPQVQVSAMAAPGCELAFGLVHDAQFGPLAMVAAGGIHIEVFRDAVFALSPFSPKRAGELIDRLSIRPVLDGVRGAPAADLDKLAKAFSDFSHLVALLGNDLSELDINPVIANEHGAVAVDALLIGKTAPETE